MATIKLVSPNPAAAYWRAAIGSVKGLPGEPLNAEITLKVLTANYYNIYAEELDKEGEVIGSFGPYEEYLLVSGEYQIDGQTKEFSKVS